MTFVEYIEKCSDFLKNNPECKDYIVIYGQTENSGPYHEVPSDVIIVGQYNPDNQDFIIKDDFEYIGKIPKLNAICIN